MHVLGCNQGLLFTESAGWGWGCGGFGGASPIPPGLMKGSSENFMRLLLLDLHTACSSCQTLLHLEQEIGRQCTRERKCRYAVLCTEACPQHCYAFTAGVSKASLMLHTGQG